MDLALRVLFHRLQIMFDRIVIQLNVLQLFPQLTSQSLGDRVREYIK